MLLQGLFQVDLVAPESHQGFGTGHLQASDQLRHILSSADTAPAPPRDRLDHDGKSVLLRKPDGFIFPGGARFEHLSPRDHGKPRIDHDPPGNHLAPHVADHIRGRADEDQPGIRTLFGKGGVFREEAITGMDGIRIGGLGGLDDPFDAEVVLAWPGTDANRFISFHDVHGSLVGFLIDRHRANPKFLGRTHDPDGDFASIGN